MGRKAKPLQEGNVDLLAEKISEEKPKKIKPHAERETARSKEEAEKIREEQNRKIKPLVINYGGKPTVVADPNCLWGFRTPPYFTSPNDLILHAFAKKAPRFLAVFDIESWQFRAGVLHHAVAARFKDDDTYLTEENFSDVKVMHSWKDFGDYIVDLLVDTRAACLADPSGSKESKVFAHHASHFDLVGLALHLGMDRNTGYWREVVVADQDGKRKKLKLNYEIVTYSGKSSISVYAGQGNGGQWRVKLLDSAHILPAKLKNLGDDIVKGVTPTQFTKPLTWINQRTSPNTGKPFDLTLRDVRPYLLVAHKVSLEDFKDALSAEAYEGLKLWKSVIEYPEYSYSDAIVLINALKRYARKFRSFTEPLRGMLGDEVVDSLEPFSFNTTSTAGFALSVAYWYESRLVKGDDGSLDIKRSLKFQQKNIVYALVDGARSYAKIVNKEELKEEIAAGTPIQYHGIVRQGERVLIAYPVWTSRFDNRFSRMAQNGSQTTVFKPMGRKVKEIDINSAFPAAMAVGCKKKIDFPGFDLTSFDFEGNEVVRKIKGSEKPVTCNALVGYEDPGYRNGMPTKIMSQLGIAKKEEMIDPDGNPIHMWVVRGRQNILHMLQFRNGEFTCVLPPSASEELGAIPLIPLRTPGRALESRLIYPRIVRPTLALIRGEYLAAYAAHPTVDDDEMVVYLCEEAKDEMGKVHRFDRSRHGPIMGVAVDGSGKVFGNPHLPHRKFFDMLFNTRLAEKKRASEAEKRGDLALAAQMTADANMTKLLMNGGGYGTYGQNKRPEKDFNLGSLDECVEIIEILTGLDPAWSGMLECVKRLAPQLEVEEGQCGWGTLYTAIDMYRMDMEAAIASGKKSSVDLQQHILISAMKTLFTEWADNHLTTFTTMRYTTPHVGANGQRIVQTRGIITAAEETAGHAIRPYASAVVAKAAVTLHTCQIQSHQSPFELVYSDTDSDKLETGVIKPFTNPDAIDYVAKAYARQYSKEPGDIRLALEELMNDSTVDTYKIFEDILKIYGVDIGSGLGQWGIERYKYDEGLASPVKEGHEFQADRSFYFASKVYIDLDADNAVGRAKVRSVPKVNPIQPAVFEGHMVGIPSLADRRGLDEEVFRHVKLDGNRRIAFGKNKVTVESMFSSPRRIYKDMGFSAPFDLEIPPEIESKILAGELVRPIAFATSIMGTMALDEEMTRIEGLRQAYMLYKAEARINGMSFDSALASVKEDKEQIQSILNESFTGNDNLNVDVIAKREGDSYSEYVAELWEAHKASGSPDPFIPF